MIRSMTAFARQELETDSGLIIWELRSVNHRYLDISLRLPEELRSCEQAARERISARIGRGKIDCTCRYRPGKIAAEPVSIDEANLGRLLAAGESIKKIMPLAAPLTTADILRWPGIVREQEVDTAPLVKATLQLLDDGLGELLESREREGRQIHALLTQRTDAIAGLVVEARALLPELRSGLKEKLQARLAELDAPADPGRLEQELVYAAQKMDVDEELDRLDGHVEEVRRVLESDKPIGRRLDFLMQEFNREANTLGSKSVSGNTTRISVDLKVLIEQMREQVQNVE